MLKTQGWSRERHVTHRRWLTHKFKFKFKKQIHPHLFPFIKITGRWDFPFQ